MNLIYDESYTKILAASLLVEKFIIALNPDSKIFATAKTVVFCNF